ncbi:5'-nucleotidase C-terminal domain-containing protein [Bifidobacterium miconis]|uniref:5'-nucleotidase C-terminal domain-containing protein n=1 Tax=Bifidobacterium miconis TaxID=2834435 RepID=UPI001C59C1E5|nr:5'-nucleotidase C-terminal domain-containing protein [Bifidobacterium miconis]
MPSIPKRLQGLLLSAALIVPLAAIPATTTVTAFADEQPPASSTQTTTQATTPADNAANAAATDTIIKDAATAVYLKRIDVGTDTVTLGSKNTKPVDVSGWLIRDDKDSADHTYTIPDGTVIPAAGELQFNLDQLAGIGLGKEDQTRVWNKSGELILSFGWSGDDKNAVYVANSDADGLVKQGATTEPDQPSGEKLDVAAWPGLDTVTAIDGTDEFGAGQAIGEHTDGNLSGLVYQPGANGKPGTLWAADNDLNPTLGETGQKGAGAINKFVYDEATGSWKQDPADGWSFQLDGKAKGGKQLHFKNGKGGVDSEGITLIDGDPSKGVFIGAERDNEDKKVPRPSILRYDVSQKTTDTNGDGAQDLTAANEWNLTDALSQFGVTLDKGDDANLGVEGVAFIPDATLTANKFVSNLDPKNVHAYDPAGTANDFGGLFFAALEKTNAVYAFALATVGGKDVVYPVAQIPLPEAAANAGYSGPRDLTWNAEHNQLLAEGDNTIGTDEKPTKAMIATYEFDKSGALQLTKLTATPTEIAAGNTEGFAVTPDAEARTVKGGKAGKTYKPVFWADDSVTNGHSLRQGWIEAANNGSQQPGQPEQKTTTINLLNVNDFHGRIDKNLTVPFASTVEQLRAAYPDSSLLLGAGDLIGASLFNSSVQRDQPTIDVLNALDLKASSVGNHEFDQGYADLTDRVIGKDNARNAKWDYLGANVYKKGTKTPALKEYSIQDVNGVKVGVIGAVTQETSTLVSPGGISGIDFGDPVEAVNRVAKQLTDGDESNGEANVIVAEYHEGAPSSEDAKTGKPTLDEQKAASPVFKEIVDQTDPAVDAIFTGHTHMAYDYADPAHNGRPIIQTGSYAANVGQVVLDYDQSTDKVTYAKSGNVPVDTSKSDDELAAAGDATVKQVKSIVDAALKVADAKGNEKVGSVAADITTAYKDGKRDDRASESTMGNLVADALLDSLKPADRGGAEIGVVNPGGLRAEFCRTGNGDKCTLAADGSITYAQANAVLPFLNNLWTTTLTGAQFKEALEQQWQTTADGTTPSRPYLQLGLSHNVSYTYDPNAKQGEHITSVTVNGQPLDPKREYRIGSFSFLLEGGDNFRAFAAGTNTKDTGLVDRDAWIEYIGKNSPLKPRYDRRAVAVTGLPTGDVTAGSSFDLHFSKLTLTSLGVPAETKLTATIGDATVGTADVANGDTADLKITVPAGQAAGAATLTIVGATNGTTVTLPITVKAGESPSPEPSPEPEPTPTPTPDEPSQPTTPTVKAVPVYRLYNPHSGLHHYTINSYEKDALAKRGWNYEGVAFKQAASASSGKPVYRAYNPNDGNHHWTADKNEYTILTTRHGWRAEGIAWYQSDEGKAVVYRAYNPKNGEHLYTTSKGEYDVITSAGRGWRAEGVAWRSL